MQYQNLISILFEKLSNSLNITITSSTEEIHSDSTVSLNGKYLTCLSLKYTERAKKFSLNLATLLCNDTLNNRRLVYHVFQISHRHILRLTLWGLGLLRIQITIIFTTQRVQIGNPVLPVHGDVDDRIHAAGHVNQQIPHNMQNRVINVRIEYFHQRDG